MLDADENEQKRMENETVEIRLQKDTLVDALAQKEADINTLTE